jgi:uncharacterized Zn-binding protein involved in type VI secretion
MGFPAARLMDNCVCPAATGPVPHVGGPITGPGCATVIIGKMPAAALGDVTVCVGPPGTVAPGSTKTLIGKKPAIRLLDTGGHGGKIVGPGCPTVLIG